MDRRTTYILKTLRERLLAVVLLGGLLHVPHAVADDGIRYRLMPYLWTAGMDVDMGRPGNTRNVDVSFSDYVDFIDLGAAFVFEARGDRWMLVTDFLWVELGEEFNLPTDTADVEINEFVIEAFAGYRPAGWDETWIIGGVRYLELDVEIDFETLNGVDADQSFADPYVGLSWQPRRGDWEYIVEGDIGGGIDADLAWSFSLGAAYHFNDRFALTGSYRYIDIDFEDDDFVFDGSMDGILLGLMITF